MALIEQEVSAEPWIDIPGEVLDILRLWRPTPLVRAERLEQALGTPARIYFKDESVSPGGLAQAEHRGAAGVLQQGEGIARLTTETGRRAVGHGARVRVRAVRPRVQGVHGARARTSRSRTARSLMETWGGEVVPVTGRRARRTRARSGSRSATRCATASAATTRTTRSARCSTTCCCTRRSSGSRPRSSSRSRASGGPTSSSRRCGGGSNLGGIALPFVTDADVRLVAVEPSSCPTLTEGRFEYDFGDTAGHDAAAADVHARPRLHAAVDPRRRAALPRRLADHLALVQDGRMEARRLPAGQDVRGRGAVRPRRGQDPGARDAATRIRAAIDEALAAKETGEERVILFNYSGHGFLDLSAYDDFHHGRLIDEQG